MIISRNDYERSWQPGMPAYAGVQVGYAGGFKNHAESGQKAAGLTGAAQTESGQDAGNISAGTSEKSTSKSTRLLHALTHSKTLGTSERLSLPRV
jgi:hypothetical protein